MWIGWGPELTYLYNDPYKAIIGGKHPIALGQPTSVVWREIWDEINPMLTTALGGDQGTYVEAQLLIMERNGYPEETYYTFSYSPIPDDEGGAGGIICANTDDTERGVRERQAALLRQLAGAAAEARTVAAACELSGRAGKRSAGRAACAHLPARLLGPSVARRVSGFRQADDERRSPVDAMDEPRGEPVLAGTRALVVDNEADARELMRYIVETGGAHVDTATSAGEALHLFNQQRFDILVADIGMPGQDGFSLIRAVRNLPESQGGRVPAIAVTAYASVREREHALEAGFELAPVETGRTGSAARSDCRQRAELTESGPSLAFHPLSQLPQARRDGGRPWRSDHLDRNAS